MAEAILSLRNVTKRFGGLVAVDNVSFDVYRGEILGLIGPNGAGKTTLFNCITGVYKPEKGRIFFRGVDITGWPPHEVAKIGIARTFQVVKPFGELSVKENVMVGALFGRKHKEMTADEAERKAGEILDFLGLGDKAELPAKALNIHEKKILELARALAAEPELLLLDEVLAGLTPKEIEVMLDIISRIRSEKRVTIIMVEHVMHAVMNIADRIVVLNYGRKIAEGTPEEVASNEEVVRAYLGDPGLALQFVKRLKERRWK